MTSQHRYPLEPLARVLRIELGRVGGSQPGQPPSGLAAIAQHLGISHTMAQRLHHDGLSERQADKYAVALGHHPGTIWPQWWDQPPDPNHDMTPDDLVTTDTHGDSYGFDF